VIDRRAGDRPVIKESRDESRPVSIPARRRCRVDRPLTTMSFDDRFRAFLVDVEDDPDLLVTAFLWQLINRGPRFSFDITEARVNIQQLIVVCADWDVSKAHP